MIGAGMGGLCAAVRLAHGGCRVTVVEAAPGPGGKMRTVDSVAGPVDAGPTVLTMRGVFEGIFRLAGQRLEDHLTLIPQPVLARHWWEGGETLDLHSDAEASAAAIHTFAGARAEADFRSFHARTAAAFAAFDAPMMQAARPRPGAIALAALRTPRLWPWLLPGMTLARALALEFRDPRLRQLFGRYATYVGGSPYRSPAILGLVWQAEARGVWTVKGGMHRLALALADLAAAGGAQFRYGVAADRITEHWGRTNAVVLADGATLTCDAVVFNGDPAALPEGLLGKAAIPALPTRATRPRSLSAQVWSFAAHPHGPATGAGLAHHNVFFTADPRDEFAPIAKGRLPDAPSIYLCAQDRHHVEAVPQGPERFEIILNAPAGLSPDPKEARRCADLTFSRLARYGLTFTPQPDPGLHPQVLTGPSGFARMFPGSEGAIYGRSPEGPMAAFRRPPARTALAGLYIAGGGAHPGAGLPMAARSGLHAAEAIRTDLALMSQSAPTAMPGGMSTGSAPTAPARSPSSGS
ncbi:MAG: 1-hydroxycarotenoid 3,4-desaturase CrtD [Pseudorhodobacter sp.]